jgi:SAM-dependent methyltransferase
VVHSVAGHPHGLEGEGAVRVAAGKDHLSEHLALVPAHRAIVRALEARLYERVTFHRPILDIGCGDGFFAQAALPTPIEVGIDPSPEALAVAERLGIYETLQQASGAELPFGDASFGTVVSNCVLEHVVEIDRAIDEIGRVLRPGGYFVGTMVTDRLSKNLGTARLLRALRMQRLGDSYAAWHNRLAVHHNMLPLAGWTEKLNHAGLEVVESRYYLSPSATFVFDLLHYFAVPSLVVRKLFKKRWLLWESPRNVAPVARVLRRLYEDDDGITGSDVFVRARKSA